MQLKNREENLPNGFQPTVLRLKCHLFLTFAFKDRGNLHIQYVPHQQSLHTFKKIFRFYGNILSLYVSLKVVDKKFCHIPQPRSWYRLLKHNVCLLDQLYLFNPWDSDQIQLREKNLEHVGLGYNSKYYWSMYTVVGYGSTLTTIPNIQLDTVTQLSNISNTLRPNNTEIRPNNTARVSLSEGRNSRSSLTGRRITALSSKECSKGLTSILLCGCLLAPIN